MKALSLILAVMLLNSTTFSQKISPKYDEYFKKYSKRYFGPAFDWNYFKAQAYAESNMNPDAESWVGAKGLMQLMPATFKELQEKNPDFVDIVDARWNIAAGILYDNKLWRSWKEQQLQNSDHLAFMFGSYNAGKGTIMRAAKIAAEQQLDERRWEYISIVAPKVPRWRHEETLSYVEKIADFHITLNKKQIKRGKIIVSMIPAGTISTTDSLQRK